MVFWDEGDVLLEECSSLKYSEDWGGWSTKFFRGIQGCTLWKNIRMGLDRFLQ